MPPLMSPSALSLRLKEEARALGFDLCGMAPAFPPPDPQALMEWLRLGYAGEMGYLQRRVEERTDPSRLLPGVRSVVCVALSYRPSAADWAKVPHHPISCYAWGSDYHTVLGPKLEALAECLKRIVPGATTFCNVDTGPVLEKSYAAQAGLGWIGKNTTLVNEHLGSMLFLGEVLTDAEMAYDEPTANACGTCTRCLESCPTGALLRPGVMDARRCLSYLTLEHRSDLPEPFQTGLHGRLAGCDACQACCPHNAQAPASSDPAFRPRREVLELTLERADLMSETDFSRFTKNSTLERVKYRLWRRNLAANGKP